MPLFILSARQVNSDKTYLTCKYHYYQITLNYHQISVFALVRLVGKVWSLMLQAAYAASHFCQHLL